MKILFTLICLSSLSRFVNAQALFQNVYIQPGNDWFYLVDFDASEDGTFYAISNDTYNVTPYIIKIDSLGNMLWNRSYFSTTDQVQGRDIKSMWDGGFVLAGKCKQIGQIYTDFFLLRADSLGHIIWSYKYDYDFFDSFHKMTITPDNGFLLTASSYQNDFLVRIDSMGNVIFFKQIIENNGDPNTIDLVEMAADSNYLVVMTNGGGRLRLLKYDINGNQLWSIGVGDTAATATQIGCYSMAPTSDGGCVMGASMHGSPLVYSTLAICKITSQGTIDWIRMKPVYSPQLQVGYAITPTYDNGYAIVNGINYTASTSITEIQLTKADSMGHFLWTKKFPGVCISNAGMKESDDHGFVIASSANVGPDSIGTILIFKTDSAGSTTCDDSYITQLDSTYILPLITLTYFDTLLTLVKTGVTLVEDSGIIVQDYCQVMSTNQATEELNLTIYPNPFNSTATLNFRGLTSDNYTLKIFNSIGMNVFTQKGIRQQFIVIDRANLTTGIYLCVLTDDLGNVGGVAKAVIE